MGFGLRLLRLILKMLAGLAISVTTYRWAKPEQRRHIVRTWSRELLAILGVTVRAANFPSGAERPVTLVANHVSWADIFALNSERACHFIAKAELREWPLAGRLLANVGTIFINRSDRKETLRLGRVVHELMDAGETVAVFPEGTTSIGHDVMKFHASLLEPVVAAGGEVWVVAIRYFAAGKRSDAAAYIGDMNLLQSLRAIHAASPMTVEVQFLRAIDCANNNRRAVAAEAEALIRAAVQSESIDIG
ncbi:MAG: 1-acyl-sn-glycerol-3-phosphate acyltransferase [Betaproteobacteria bacterium]|nr:MAG: 1-acyl-sn-glycerol-3-phosphate acyltransferase [Betaproteobacteria bacterium]